MKDELQSIQNCELILFVGVSKGLRQFAATIVAGSAFDGLAPWSYDSKSKVSRFIMHPIGHNETSVKSTLQFTYCQHWLWDSN